MTHRIQLADAFVVFAKINLHANQDQWNLFAKVNDLWQPLCIREKIISSRT
jgi:hypothetical protein